MTPSNIPRANSASRRPSVFSGFKVPSPRPEQTIQAPDETAIDIHEGYQPQVETSRPGSSRKSLKRALSSQLSRVNSVLRGQPSHIHDSPPALPVSATHASSLSSDDVAGPRFQRTTPVEPVGERTAGDPAVYSNITVCFYLDTRFQG